MKFSVVIPAYNAGNSLPAAIESCLAQTLPAHEIIIVDDASTDDTEAIAQQYEQVTLLQQLENAGPSAARNKGWDAATGDVIAFLDADDVWHPDKLKVLSAIFTDYGHIQYLGHSYVVNEFEEIDTETLRVSHEGYWSVIARNPYQPSCIAVRRQLLDRFDESYRYCEDHELSIRMAHIYASHWLDMPLTKLGRPQLSAGGASGNTWEMRKGELRLYSSIYKHNILYAVAIPFLWVWSMCKLLYRGIFR